MPNYIDWNQGNESQHLSSQAPPAPDHNTSGSGGIFGPISAGMNMVYDQLTQGQQMDNQIELMDVAQQNQLELMAQQFQNQMGLNVQGHELQFQQWLRTNYPAQVEQMKKAGLNVGLMYGMKGGGGTTTGSQGGGSAAGGSAGLGMAPQRRKEMQLAEMMMGLQMDKLKADTKLVEAQADNESPTRKDGKTYQEIMKLQKENNILQKDINWYEKNNIAPSEYGIIKALQSARGIWADDVKEILGMTFKEKIQMLIDENLIDESEKGNLGLIYKWEKKNGRKWKGEYIPGLKETENLLFGEQN
jgi:hypothetical protein